MKRRDDAQGSAWRTFRLFEFKDDGRLSSAHNLPPIPACYVIYLGSKLTYVGQTVNLQARINGHDMQPARYSNFIETPWGRDLHVTIKYRPSRAYGDWAMVELRLIRKLQPVGNIVHRRTQEARA